MPKRSIVPILASAALACTPARVPLNLWSPGLIALPDTAAHVRVRIDSARRELVLVGGPFRVPALPTGMGHHAMSMAERDSLLGRFVWPQDAWLRGFELALRDESGHPLPRALLHHLSIKNLDRRQLLHPIIERLMAFGRETEAVSLPATVGIPMKAGQRISLYAMWDNDTGREIEGVYVVLTLRWAPHNQVPRPIAAFPLPIDVNHVVGGEDTFDVPPGGCVATFEFSPPIGGHLLIAGGHLHDHGISLRLEDAGTGKAVVTLVAKRDRSGAVLGISRKLLALWGQGPWLRADHRYRLVAVYDNPTPDTVRAVMAFMAGLFAPDDPRQWPAIDPQNQEYRLDLMAHSGAVYQPGPRRGAPCRPGGGSQPSY
jgi:hypothetical protein